MQYRLIRRHTGAPLMTLAMTGLGSVVYSAESWALRGVGVSKECPLVVVVEGNIVIGAGTGAGASVALRTIQMSSAIAPTTNHTNHYLMGRSAYKADGQEATLFTGAVLVDQGWWAAFSLGIGAPMPLMAPYLGLRFSNPGTAYTGGTINVTSISIWG
jgi:hypothetical protein